MAHDPDLDVDRSPAVFERAYRAPGDGFDRIPWARLAPHPRLVAFLDEQDPDPGLTALVIGCGLGDDAEELARRGFRVTAFDLAPAAIDLCQQRFPTSEVAYRVGNVFDLGWTAPGFELVVEIATVQSIDPDTRSACWPQLAASVAPGGRLFLVCYARGDNDPTGDERPWPISRAELSALAAGGLVEETFVDDPSPTRERRHFTAVYRRPSAA